MLIVTIKVLFLNYFPLLRKMHRYIGNFLVGKIISRIPCHVFNLIKNDGFVNDNANALWTVIAFVSTVKYKKLIYLSEKLISAENGYTYLEEQNKSI